MLFDRFDVVNDLSKGYAKRTAFALVAHAQGVLSEEPRPELSPSPVIPALACGAALLVLLFSLGLSMRFAPSTRNERNTTWVLAWPHRASRHQWFPACIAISAAYCERAPEP